MRQFWSTITVCCNYYAEQNKNICPTQTQIFSRVKLLFKGGLSTMQCYFKNEICCPNWTNINEEERWLNRVLHAFCVSTIYLIKIDKRLFVNSLEFVLFGRFRKCWMLISLPRHKLAVLINLKQIIEGMCSFC